MFSIYREVSTFIKKPWDLRSNREKRTEPYNLGENEFHTAFSVSDMEGALKKHKEMDCVVYENPDMGIYFIVDPDGYWLEIVPENM